MTAHFWVAQPSGAPAPADLSAYLLQRGWTHQETNTRWAIYSAVLSNEEVALEVPQQASAPDYARAVSILVADLARLEERDATSLLRDIRASSVDIVRLAIESNLTRDGRIPVEAGYRVYEAARDLLLSAACSVVEPRAVFAKRKPDEAMKLLSRARFGQTEFGSFVLTMECSVPPRLGQSTLFDDTDPDAPFERKTSVRLARALAATELATRQSAASGKIVPFNEHTKDGVSANLCDALAEILEATSAETLRASFSFAACRPLSTSTAPVRAVAFSADTSAILREASRGLRELASYPGTELTGTVVKLDSPNSSAGGDAVLRVDLDGRMRHVRLSLAVEDYQKAIQAHSGRDLVHCVGDLKRDGRSWVLLNPREFEPRAEFEEA